MMLYKEDRDVLLGGCAERAGVTAGKTERRRSRRFGGNHHTHAGVQRIDASTRGDRITSRLLMYERQTVDRIRSDGTPAGGGVGASGAESSSTVSARAMRVPSSSRTAHAVDAEARLDSGLVVGHGPILITREISNWRNLGLTSKQTSRLKSRPIRTQRWSVWREGQETGCNVICCGHLAEPDPDREEAGRVASRAILTHVS